METIGKTSFWLKNKSRSLAQKHDYDKIARYLIRSLCAVNKPRICKQSVGTENKCTVQLSSKSLEV